MHLLMLLSILLVLGSIVALAIGYTADGDREERVGRTLRRVGWGSWIVITGIWAAILFGQPTLCTTLGGEWYADNEACRHELGGNGSNDPGTSWVPWA